MTQTEIEFHQQALRKILQRQQITPDEIARSVELLLATLGVGFSLLIESASTDTSPEGWKVEHLIEMVGGIDQVGLIVKASTDILESRADEVTRPF